jgi:ClpX C4-type zinc finger
MYVSTVGCRNAILVFMSNNLHCSFCNQSEDQIGPLLAKMDTGPKRQPVRICKGCAEMAIETIDREVLRRAAEKPRVRLI